MLDSGYAFSSPDDHDKTADRELASMRVLQHNEKLRSFDRASVAAITSLAPAAATDKDP